MAKTNVSNLAITLQDSICPSDSKWYYSIPNLPETSTLNLQGLIKSVSVVPNPTKQHITLRFIKASANRATAIDTLDKFVQISFADFRLRHTNGNPATNGDEIPSSTPASARESADYVTLLLQTGITINGATYNFYGHSNYSNSQLKSRSRAWYLYAALKEDIALNVENFGDFTKMKSVAKKAKRIALLFSAADIACQVEEENCEDIDDVESGDYNFTDGCGLISKDFAKFLVTKMNIRFRNQKYMPSVFQIRYRGYKGVLTVNPTMKGKVKIKFRKSMRKFKGGEDLSFSVTEYAKV